VEILHEHLRILVTFDLHLHDVGVVVQVIRLALLKRQHHAPALRHLPDTEGLRASANVLPRYHLRHHLVAVLVLNAHPVLTIAVLPWARLQKTQQLGIIPRAISSQSLKQLLFNLIPLGPSVLQRPLALHTSYAQRSGGTGACQPLRRRLGKAGSRKEVVKSQRPNILTR
jgi:hypothetical protein